MSVRKPRPANRIGRKRRAAGWTLLALGVLVAAVWVASGWSRFGWRQGNSFVLVYLGLLSAGTQDGYEIRDCPWEFERYESSAPAHWWHTPKEEDNPAVVHSTNLLVASYETRRYDTHEWCVVVWPIPLLLWTPAALLLRSGIVARRRAITGICTKCGYSLAGLTDDAPCPECGKVRQTESKSKKAT